MIVEGLTMSDLPHPDKTFHIFDRLLSQPGSLCKIESDQPKVIYQKLSRYQDTTGKALYFWREGVGLHRIDIPNIYAPNTKSFIKALHHVSLSIHFGIYLFANIKNALHDPQAIKLIEQIANNQVGELNRSSQQRGSNKLLIFVGNDLDIPEQLEEYFTVIRHRAARKYQRSPTHQLAS